MQFMRASGNRRIDLEVKLAKTAGFCFGVKRAVDTVYEQVDHPEQTPIYTFGPIIHNEEVIADLEKKVLLQLIRKRN